MIVDIENQISLVELIKGVLPSALKKFTKNYIKEHTYIKLKDVSYCYIETHYNSPLLRHEKSKLITILNHKLGKLIPELKSEGLIAKYNGKTYKRVEKVKSENNSNSVRLTTKIEIPEGYSYKDYRKERLDIKIGKGVKLTFIDGSFKNPKSL